MQLKHCNALSVCRMVLRTTSRAKLARASRPTTWNSGIRSCVSAKQQSSCLTIISWTSFLTWSLLSAGKHAILASKFASCNKFCNGRGFLQCALPLHSWLMRLAVQILAESLALWHQASPLQPKAIAEHSPHTNVSKSPTSHNLWCLFTWQN